MKQRAQQARLLDQTHDPILVRDMNSVITYWNRAAEELYGWRAEEVIGRRSYELLKTVFPAPLDELQEQLLRTGHWEGELTRTKADGSSVTVACRWALRRDGQDQAVSILETNNDISARKHREEEIRRLNRELERRADELEIANKELESFAYSVSHDLRAPLRHSSEISVVLGDPVQGCAKTMPGSNLKIVPGSHDGFNSVGAAATRDKKLPRSLARCRLRYHQCLTGRIKIPVWRPHCSTRHEILVSDAAIAKHKP